jgi:hypothetical protein
MGRAAREQAIAQTVLLVAANAGVDLADLPVSAAMYAPNPRGIAHTARPYAATPRAGTRRAAAHAAAVEQLTNSAARRGGETHGERRHLHTAAMTAALAGSEAGQ